MPAYVLLTRLNSEALRQIKNDPKALVGVRQTLEDYEANILADYHLLGKFNHCTVFEVSDNFRAQKAALSQELTSTKDTLLLPAIDYELFQRMLKQEIRTDGPHEWQIRWWAKVARLCFRWYQFSRWMWRYCKPFTVTGLENFKDVKGPCIVVGNHTSHFDALALFHGLPQRIKWNIYFGAAADRWFLKKGGGRKELVLQPWYNSLIGGNFPIKRGGGSKTLDYSKWLLDKGANLAIFPEGTRSTSKKMSRFKHGVALLAIEKKVPIVPVYLAGLSKLRPKGSREVFPGPASAHIQPPIYLPEGISVPDATRLIYDALNHCHERVIKHGDDAGRWDWVEDLD
ncbi:MAG: 1-acyl-sn-glycerol-3-phosphate acyltransferase [Flavobacterium sp.]|jgi:1-acyl-sn-glycerol-3-phosphate acyltransferase